MHLLTIGLLLLAITFGANVKAERERPNILLFLLDAAGFMDFGAYGSERTVD